MMEPDLMLKYSTFMCFIVFIGIVTIQSLNSPYVVFLEKKKKKTLYILEINFFFLISLGTVGCIGC